MMKFTNLTRQIQDGCDGTPALEDILGMMISLCEDVRFETKTLVEKCPVNNRERMIDRLYTISYTLNYIYEKHSQEISDFDPSCAEDEIWRALAEIEQKCGIVHEQIKQMDGTRAQLKSVEAQLQKDIEVQKAKQTEVAACRQRIADLESELRQLKESKLPVLQQTCATLEAEAAARRADHEALSKKAETLKPQAEAARTALQKKQQEVARLEAELEKLRQDGTDAATLSEKLEAEKIAYNTAIEALAGLRTELDTVRGDNAQMAEELETVKVDLETAKNDHKHTSDQLSDAAKDLQDLRKKVNDNKVNIKTTQNQIDAKQKDFAQSDKQLKQLEDELGKIAQSCEGIMADIRRKKEQLRNMDPEAIRRDLEQEEASLNQQIEEANSLQRQTESIRGQIEAQEPDLTAARLLLNELTGKQQAQQKELEDMRQKTDQLRADLKLLENKDFQDRLLRSTTKLELLTQLHTRMTRNIQLLDCGWSANLEDGLQKQITLAEHTIQELQQAVSQYARQWQADLNGGDITV